MCVLEARVITVPRAGDGMRVDRFLSRRFRRTSRTTFARAIRDGRVQSPDHPRLRKSTRVRAGDELHIRIPGIAPTEAPPPLPPVLHEDSRIIALDKPPGLLCHPAGPAHSWSAIGLARERWPHADLAHRLDRDTSGVLVLSLDRATNAFLKAAFKSREVVKEYLALCRQAPPWDRRLLEGPIGPADGPIRIQMAVRPDGLPARTEVEVLQRDAAGRALVRCRIHSGRTHQIRVHLAQAGCSVVGDRMYGVPPSVFLRAYEQGVDEQTWREAGAPRHALHAARLRLIHPEGHPLELRSRLPADIRRWWERPELLPLDRSSGGEDSPSS